ncbi:MAG: 1,4-alpha-glucan branching enzyme [Candidatus Omnitrophica bacterium CG11_big_fil_rev_8_21_14_0_20_45_26]|uniref:1,4-alpha-glucan branching enzyme GlgB n=1 Tax=Candidatus Abzuiibacterium crystallinum TaxID=1974748 RepID=A0A2H0LU29_9BACT|nr:MAG: 1,4-alpha-glucan branching enzyme [Candidatus Omnitrophica bacterium CG11_big_fil_rev_8_21_14_0_20_45_26]
MKQKNTVSRKQPARVLSDLAIDPGVQKAIHRIIDNREDEPYDILGPHLIQSHQAVVIRAFLPRAQEASIVRHDHIKQTYPMTKTHEEGVFQVCIENEKKLFPYTIQYREINKHEVEIEDPYAHRVQMSDFDLHLLGEGKHYKSYEKFGAHLFEMGGTSGVHFAVWAPNAKAVSLVGDFNHWRPGAHPMSRVHFSGLWVLFVPGLKEGALYKFAIRGADDHVHFKSDPYSFHTEIRPHTACRVSSLDYQWHDQPWLDARIKKDILNSPVSVYEIHLGSWKRDEKNNWSFLSYRDLAHQLVPYLKELGFTHVELLPIMEHPLDESWGYQVVNYFAPTSRFGGPKDFMYFVDYCHQNGIGVLVDWVPGHFPRDAHGLGNFDGREIYAYESWKKREHKDWGTFVFDYGRSEVRNFLISNALFWLDKYHIDGLRVDAVASMLYLNYSRSEGEWEANMFGSHENLEAIDFLKKFNEEVHLQFPGVLTIAEESTAWTGVSRPTYLGGLGFSLKWNMGWMHDTLEYFSKDSIHRRYHQGTLTFSMLYAFTENFMLPLSHDEVVHGKGSLLQKMSGDDWQQFANLRLLYSYMYSHPGKKLLFMGSEFAQRDEWQSRQSLDWHLLGAERHRQVHDMLRDLNQIYQNHPALYEVDFESSGFEWIDFSDADASILSFVRWSRDHRELIVAACNMTPVPRMGYRIGVPREGFYREIFNSDAVEYGGSGIGNYGGFRADAMAWHNRPFSMCLNFPPLAAVILKHEG